MTTIKSLCNLSLDELYTAFNEAFIDYEMQLNKSQLHNMLKRRGFEPELSFGAFDDNKLVAFTFNGIGSFNDIKTAYDTGTGTIKDYRGQGLAGKIFEFSIPYLKKAGVEQYLLEVLQHNEKAVGLYKKLGFKVTREFYYFIQSNEDLKINQKPQSPGYTIESIDIPSRPEVVDFEDIVTSWQNSFDSIHRTPDNFKAFAVFFHKKMVGYCIVEPGSGDISRLAIEKTHRRKGLGTRLFNRAISENQYNSIKIINIPIEPNGIVEFLNSNGIVPTGKQYEMIKQL